MKFPVLHEFTDAGLNAFRKAFTGQLVEDAIDPFDRHLVRRLEDTREFEVTPFASAMEMADAVLNACGSRKIPELIAREGLWAWLTFVQRDVLFPKGADGRRKFREVHRWYPSDPGDWQKAQRHLVRMPVLLRHQLGDSVDYILCGPPSILPEIREQMTSQQDMLHPAFQQVARRLYFDTGAGRLKRGAGSKRGGSPRRLATVRQQLDVTWNLFDLDPDHLFALLPTEFDSFRNAA